ncbi:MAG: histidine kinase [Ginsengibacter sp.]
MNQSIFIKYKLHHLIFWLGVFGLWYYFRFQDFPTKMLAIKVTVVKVADLALLVYITNLILIPKLLYKKKYLIFSLVYLVMIATSTFWKINIIGNMVMQQEFNIWDNFKTRVYDNFIPHVLLVSTGTALKLLVDYANAQRRIGDMAKEKAEAELNFLKQQINPHFLFNSLNAVYFLIDKNNEEARNALHGFSEMLRYQLYECNGEKISIEKELSYLDDYVNLQQLRKAENFEIKFIHADSVKDFFIEPLLLIPFVENSFKHLSHFETEVNEVHIEVNKTDNRLILDVRNTKRTASNGNAVGGIGLANVKRRLELLYHGKHKLSIKDDETWYKVNLEIDIS